MTLSSDATCSKVDVLIIGGGPGGLALANSVKLHLPNLTCKVRRTC
jgi:cation diffusion facilitator CzcD-associated flavoprotein CzcO